MFDGTRIGATPVAQDTAAPDWSFDLAPTDLIRTDAVRITIYDEDGDTDELIASCTKPLSDIAAGSNPYDPYFFYDCVLTSSSGADAGVDPQYIEFSLTLQQ